jgi:hypothetical protein
MAKTGALVFACPRDTGANALDQIFREGRVGLRQTKRQSRNHGTAGLYRVGEGESKAWP